MLPPGGGVKGTGRGSRAASLPASPRPPREVAPGRLSLEGAGMCLSQSRVWGLGLYLHPHDAEPALREASSCTRGRRLVPCEWEGSGEESAPAPAALVCLRMPSSQIAQPSAPPTHHSVRWYSDTHTCTQVHTHTSACRHTCTHARRYTRTFADAGTPRAGNMHTRTWSAPASWLNFFLRGKSRGQANASQIWR